MLQRTSDPGDRYLVAALSDTLSEPATANAAEGLPDLRYFFSLVRRQLWMIAAIAAIGTALSTFVALKLTSQYTAVALVMVDPGETHVVNTQAVVSDVPREDASIESEVQLIKSVSVAERVVNKLDLTKKVNERKPSIISKVLRLLGLSRREKGAEPSAEELRDRAARNLSDWIETSRRETTFLIEVAYTDPDPKFAANIANAFADCYLEEQLQAKFSTTEQATKWLDDRLVDLRAKVATAERAVETFRAEKGLTQAEGTTLNDQQMKELNGQLVEARATAAAADAKRQQVNEIIASGGDATSLAGAFQSDVLLALESKLSETRREYAELTSKYGSRHPAVISVGAQVANLKSQVAAEVTRLKDFAENEYRVAYSRQQSLEASLRELEQGAHTASQDEVRLRELEREATATRTLYENFLARSKETNAQETLQTPDSRIVERAGIPDRPSRPHRLAIALTGFLFSVGLGLGAAYLRDRMDDGFHTGDQIKEAIGVPLLASVPVIGTTAKQRRLLRRIWRRQQTSSSQRKRWKRNAAILRASMASHVTEKPLSAFTEAIRSLRMGIRHSGFDSPHKQVVLVTSALPGDGKSTITGNLAQHAANAGERVLLIDMDMRHPALTEVHAPDSKAGMLELISGLVGIRDAIRPLGKAYFLPASRSSHIVNTAEVLGSEKVRDLLSAARKTFDLIVIDAPPLVPVTDSRALVDAVDGVVLVIQWDLTSRAAVHSALQLSFGLREKVIGAVLNQVDPNRARFFNNYETTYYGKKYPDYHREDAA